MSKLKDAVVAALVLLVGKGRKDPYANLPEQR
ncbi:MAG: hypothetical protein QOH23_2382, partial [Gaiellaceae bacterium]|nr:hypothetical protein [Gaiellaceae bacterium]